MSKTKTTPQKNTKRPKKNIFRQRLARDNFFGLKLTIILVILAYIFVAFAAVVGGFVGFQDVFVLDSRIDALMVAMRTPGLVTFFLMVTSLALPQFAAGVGAALAVILLAYQKKRLFFWPFIISFGGGIITNYLSKLSLERSRPAGAVYSESGYSFPSGHATTAVVLYGFIIYYLLRKNISRAAKNFVVVFGVILILAIGFSRLYLGVHFFSDVIGGYLLGLVWLCAGIGLAEWHLDKRSKGVIIK